MDARVRLSSRGHPADEMGDVRERIAEFTEREGELREILIAATEAERVGEEWIAQFSEQQVLQPFMRERVATVLKLKDAHTGRQRRRRCNSGGRPATSRLSPLG